jgi:hypothetical protein
MLTFDSKIPTATMHCPLPSEDSNFRHVWLITHLLLKIKRQAREKEIRKNPSRTRDVHEKKVA